MTFLGIAPPTAARAEIVSHCDDVAACHKLFAEGRRLALLGQNAPALAAFQAAFDRSHDVSVLPALGRALQLLGKNDAAMATYQNYLVTAPYDEPSRLQVVEWIRELLPEVSAAQDTAPPPVEPPVQQSVERVRDERCTAVERKRRRLQIGGGIALGVAAIGLASSAVLISMHGQLTDGVCVDDRIESGCKWDTRPAYIPGLVGSGVAVFAGGLTLALAHRETKAKRNLACAGR